MDSAKAPLFLCFENTDTTCSSTVNVLFKAGDDLRQDILTIQMLNIMDKIWKENGLDLFLTPYAVISTGDDIGMVEIVPCSETISGVQRSAGGSSVTAAFRALNSTPLSNWLKRHNRTNEEYEIAVENFTKSCAAYCVATYILGIGDRHNDNIMVTQQGILFHIDFGHFLGNFKTWGGIKREKAPFVLTPEFALVMGGKDGENFKKFIELCKKGYNSIRKHANVFINLFMMMLSTGIPELKSEEDLRYLRDAFALDLSPIDASKLFERLIFESLSSVTTQLNFAVHNLAH